MYVSNHLLLYNKLFYLNYEECKYLYVVTNFTTNLGFILTMRNVNGAVANGNVEANIVLS
ncbi:MAG: hypothetical protein ACRCWG_05210 [Sarcina sp.]